MKGIGRAGSTGGTYPLYIWSQLQECGRGCGSEGLRASNGRVETDVGHRAALQDDAVILKKKDTHTYHHHRHDQTITGSYAQPAQPKKTKQNYPFWFT